MIDIGAIPTAHVAWPDASRIARSAYQRVDPFDDIADPADWPLLVAAAKRTGTSFPDAVDDPGHVPVDRRADGPGASHLMGPFTQLSPDRQSRFSDGSNGVLYTGRTFEVALFETVHHHGRFMDATKQAPGWTSQFLGIALDIEASLHDLRDADASDPVFSPEKYAAGQALGMALRDSGSDGLVYSSVRYADGDCAALFYPNLASNVREVRQLDYHWNGSRVDFYRDLGSGDVYRIG